MPARYHFVTELALTADDTSIWRVLQRSEDWPSWWRWLLGAEILDEGDEAGLGRTVRNTVSTPVGYRLTYVGRVTNLVERRLIEFDASGDLAGTGRFLIASDGHRSMIVFDWLVDTTRWWMNLLAPVARPAFSWNHNRLMTDFARGLAEVTGATLIHVENRSLAPTDPGFSSLSET
jgi:hypothetical protein